MVECLSGFTVSCFMLIHSLSEFTFDKTNPETSVWERTTLQIHTVRLGASTPTLTQWPMSSQKGDVWPTYSPNQTCPGGPGTEPTSWHPTYHCFCYYKDIMICPLLSVSLAVTLNASVNSGWKQHYSAVIICIWWVWSDHKRSPDTHSRCILCQDSGLLDKKFLFFMLDSLVYGLLPLFPCV